MRRPNVIGIVAAAGVSVVTMLSAQSGPSTTSAAPALIIGASGNMTPIVANLEEDARFYADLLGLDNPPRIRRRSHADVPYPEVLKNQGTPDATIRQVNLDIPVRPGSSRCWSSPTSTGRPVARGCRIPAR
jgi:hypothetical protein